MIGHTHPVRPAPIRDFLEGKGALTANDARFQETSDQGVKWFAWQASRPTLARSGTRRALSHGASTAPHPALNAEVAPTASTKPGKTVPETGTSL